MLRISVLVQPDEAGNIGLMLTLLVGFTMDDKPFCHESRSLEILEFCGSWLGYALISQRRTARGG